MDDKMSIEFLHVTFPQSQTVLANGIPVGFTNRTFIMPSGVYTITLDGDPTSPPSQDVTLMSTTSVTPAVLAFLPA